MTFRVKLVLTGIEGLPQRKVNTITRESMKAVGERWHDKYLPKHFTKAGAQEYGYGARKGEAGSGEKYRGSYTAWKKKKYGHEDPLVKTGKGKREALRNKKVKATATAKRATCNVTLPNVFNFRNPRSRTNPPEEIRRVSRRELADLEEFLVDEIERQYEKAGRQVSAQSRILR